MSIRGMRAAAAMVLSLPLLAAALVAGPAHATDFVGDDERDLFVGSGSLILPVSMYSAGRESAATCPGCQWKATLACDKVSAGSCRGPARLCGADGEWLRIWIKRPGGDWQDLGAACFGPGGPATRAQFEIGVRQIVEEAVPPLRPQAQPPTGVLPHLPVAFRSGQTSDPVRGDYVVLGIPLELTATAAWAWDFGDGEGLDTRQPGGRWPDLSVAHTYRRAGAVEVRVLATWRADYSVGGVGPLQVEQPVRQDRSMTLTIGEGRAVLVR